MNNYLANNIKYLREKNNMSQEELANRLKIKSYSTVGKWEIGKSKPTLETVKKLALIFNEDFRDMVDLDLSSNITKKINTSISSMLEVPIAIAGAGGCGLGRVNDTNVTEWFNTPTEWLRGNYDNYFWAIASGNSMLGSGINNGSMLLFRKQNNIECNEIGVFHLNGEEFVKKFQNQNGTILLVSTNPEYAPIVVTVDDDFRVIAKLVKQITDFE